MESHDTLKKAMLRQNKYYVKINKWKCILHGLILDYSLIYPDYSEEIMQRAFRLAEQQYYSSDDEYLDKSHINMDDMEIIYYFINFQYNGKSLCYEKIEDKDIDITSLFDDSNTVDDPKFRYGIKFYGSTGALGSCTCHTIT